MKIKPKTPRTEMTYHAITAKMSTFYEHLADELGFGPEAVDLELIKFAAVSARVEFEKKEVDFEVAIPTDTVEQIREKFSGYMDTKQYLLVEEAERQIAMADLPMSPPEQQPASPEPSEKNS